MISPIRSRSSNSIHWSFLVLQLVWTTTTTIVVEATFSIIALDRTNGIIGAAGASCSQHRGNGDQTSGDDIVHIIPGRGILITQALAMGADAPPLLLGESLLQNHTNPQEILNSITNPSVDHQSALTDAYLLRQYGLVDFDGRSAGYTGSSLNTLYDDEDNEQRDLQGSYTDDLTGTDYVYSIQGNLISHRTLEIVEDTFKLDGGCDLAEKLYLAVMAVDMAGEGDARCPESVAGSMAFLQVENQGGDILASTVTHGDSDDPELAFDRFTLEFDNFRMLTPCPGEEGAAVAKSAASRVGILTLFGSSVAVLATITVALL